MDNSVKIALRIIKKAMGELTQENLKEQEWVIRELFTINDTIIIPRIKDFEGEIDQSGHRNVREIDQHGHGYIEKIDQRCHHDSGKIYQWSHRDCDKVIQTGHADVKTVMQTDHVDCEEVYEGVHARCSVKSRIASAIAEVQENLNIIKEALE